MKSKLILTCAAVLAALMLHADSPSRPALPHAVTILKSSEIYVTGPSGTHLEAFEVTLQDKSAYAPVIPVGIGLSQALSDLLDAGFTLERIDYNTWIAKR